MTASSTITFGQLSSKYNLPNSIFFVRGLLQHFVRENILNFETIGESHILRILFHQRGKGIYNTELPGDIWRTALSHIRSCSINRRHRLIHFKVIHRFYYSEVMLHNFYSSVSPLCDNQMTVRCCSYFGTVHLLINSGQGMFLFSLWFSTGLFLLIGIWLVLDVQRIHTFNQCHQSAW